MTLAEDSGPERGGDDILAAEYVLGVLSADERRQVSARIAAEPDFARMVDRWEVHLAPLAVGYPEIDVAPSVKQAIDRRLFTEQTETAGRPRLWSSLGFWRGLAAAAVAALAIYVAVPYINPPAQAPREFMVASLAADGSDVKYMIMYDAATNEIGLSHVAGERASGKDFELWMIDANAQPVSMGVIPAGTTMKMPVKEGMRGKFAAGTVLAVSVEPVGGSPTGLPTGPVVAAGDLRQI
ncbi:anti-sigma factor [Aminobacter sp. AP02]|uniref:anti-sigma factor n=1 Tax=Aminobacter sp. AP02 TaxID=2135737 RepID=UPI000D6AAD16|nr:anti-sigma factor [Aminobacter sp. AP02]PWK68440.1 anti-sigma-K factor RskA [Aminobacter sp. AP02]